MDNLTFSKTSLDTKKIILADFYAANSENEYVFESPFWKEYSDTMMVCLFDKVGYVSIQDTFVWLVDQAWAALLLFLDLDEYGEYSDYTELIELANINAEEWDDE